MAVTEALRFAQTAQAQCRIFTDSQLVVNQLNGSWQVKSDNIRSWYEEAKDLIEPHVIIEWVKGIYNKADELTRTAFERATGWYPLPRTKGQYKAKLEDRGYLTIPPRGLADGRAMIEQMATAIEPEPIDYDGLAF